jgi:hypothetical protein
VKLWVVAKKKRFVQTANSAGQTPLMYMIEGTGIGFPYQIEHAISRNKEELPSALFGFIREEVTKYFVASFKSLASPDLMKKWKGYGFDIGSVELALLTLIYKGLQSRYKELITKLYLHEIMGWV